MRIVIGRVPRIGTHGAQVFEMNLAQSTLKLLTHAQIDRELVGCKFIVSGKGSQDKGQNLVHGSPQGLEKQHQGDNGWNRSLRVVKAKCTIKIRRCIALRKEIKGGPKVQLRHHKVCERVSQLPMAQLVTKNSENLVIVYLLQKRIEQD